MAKKIAVICCNLGGPSSIDSVQPFLFNLFNDRAIIALPQPLRYLIAKIISKKRAPLASAIYQEIGGSSPINAETQAQMDALTVKLREHYAPSDTQFMCMMVMRYWHPRAKEVTEKLKRFKPDAILFLPLYPQFSTTTTASSLKEWQTLLKKSGIKAPMKTICCYFAETDFISAHCDQIKQTLKEKSIDQMQAKQLRFLFSAHGLPEKVIEKGDPYQWQVEQTVAAIAKAMPEWIGDHHVCYQSKVGPLKWIGPSTEEEIQRAAKDNKSVVIIPIAFVSEHSETLVELDIEYKKLAEEAGVKQYIRVATLSTSEGFIKALAAQIQHAMVSEHERGICHARHCPKEWQQCPNRNEGKAQEKSYG